MDFTSTTAFVTGADRGLGRHLAAELLARGATGILADEVSRSVRAGLSADVTALYGQLR